MTFSTRKKYPIKHLPLVAVITAMGMLFHINCVNAEDTLIPPGFQRMPNGDIMVEDPIIAVAPQGYRISNNGILEKEEAVAAKTDDAMENSAATSSEAEEIPPGFHRMPNGDIMANNPSKAVAPPGYRLTESGILKRMDDGLPDMVPATAVAAAATVDDFGGEIPSGYHRMPDGTLMANSPSKAVAPEGYHLMPDGTLMANGTSVDHSMHSHGGGGMWMAEYKFEHMEMDCCLDTTNKVSPEEVINRYGYMMSPTDMTMDMHMFMLMYHTSKYMVMLMAHYMSNEMGMLESGGGTSTMKSSGIADTILTVQAPWRYNLGFTVGMSFPTGSINERGPMGAAGSGDFRYPYGMQLGSGTYDVILGFDYEDSKDKLAWGADYEYTLRTGTNDNDYTLGDKSILDGWVRWNFTNTINGEANLQFREIGKISGADPELNPGMSPATDASNYGGRRIDLGVAVKYETPQMTSIGAEFTMPVYQNLYGPQMEVTWIAGINFGFMF
ncbi:hypothetical protein [Kaarinaea lacus]